MTGTRPDEPAMQIERRRIIRSQARRKQRRDQKYSQQSDSKPRQRLLPQPGHQPRTVPNLMHTPSMKAPGKRRKKQGWLPYTA